MTKQQILTGTVFTVFGIKYDMQYILSENKINFYLDGKIVGRSILSLEDEKTFAILVNVFGVSQMILIAFAHCEPK